MIAEKETARPIETLKKEFRIKQHERTEYWQEVLQEGVVKRIPRYVEMLSNNNPTLRGSLEAMEKTLFEIYERENPCGVMDEDELNRLQERRMQSLLEDFHNLLERIIDRALI